MSSSDEQKPQYFANGDFEKAVADIILTPRRSRLNYEQNESLFQFTDKQRDYYTKCFRYLLKTTQESACLSGALNGADPRVIEFFQRSGLDNEALSKIWSLSDVNEDGWLDLNEFSIAMHLIVLKVKGEVPIPACLPDSARPPITPSRIGIVQNSPSAVPQPIVINSDSTPSLSTSNGVALHDSWDKFDTSLSSQPTAAAPLLEPSPTSLPSLPLNNPPEFSDVPPLLVDSRPTAVKQVPSALLLSLKSPTGPPPAPPPRPQQKGHGRSASLDLKMMSNAFSPDGCPLSLPNADRRESDSAATRSHMSTSLKTPINELSTVFPPPNIPPRTSQRIATPSKQDAETQTVEKAADLAQLEKFIAEFDSKLQNLLGEDIESSEEKGADRWKLRCEALRQQNAEMERERAKLAQVRIQLQLRLQEIEEQAKSNSSTLKPTSI
ncbi:hypothetical protein WR25_24135 [Diploscapter pachys]|uniref:EF-hand domain-containing protein n=1 Tax=Diploscapter pachys TaxID=2018661 RepID=A0A2A2K1N4_9BILA|nr:hypothetical protein WR25_24135 [Diploscapter pachys]